ncbi:AAA family ATPase [Longispora sp. NPDC051575]|uniref:AAA family ATPase n=1 Tax=Longispora sp. NPDC051575 TaxID=3154943 RepID=UPI00343648F6
MRLLRLEIDSWRHLQNVVIEPPEDATMICLAGENGSGKTSVLELVAAICSKIRISTGAEYFRSDPFGESHSFRATFQIPDYFREKLYGQENVPDEDVTAWTGTITVEYKTGVERVWRAGGLEDGIRSYDLANACINHLGGDSRLHYVYLDADRSYPKVEVSTKQVLERLEQPNEDAGELRKSAVQQSAALYAEWIRYCLGVEARSAFAVARQLREGVSGEEVQRRYSDPFRGYRDSLAQVLPGLTFIGPDEQSRTLQFDSGGNRVPFHHLSGGERELAFLLGQIDRFQLKTGMLFIDEPELHLNPDLLRVWLTYLRETLVDGQVWIATHSLEAVEAAGAQATYVVERDRTTYGAASVQLLAERPVLSVLARSLGTPAFSLSKLRFVYVEGEAQLAERDRFARLAGNIAAYRFIEAGGCAEVRRQLVASVRLAAETDEQLHVGAVVDRDFRTLVEVEELTAAGFHVLEVHEAENFFLQPEIGEVICGPLQDTPFADLLRDSSDHFAGLWVIQRAAQQAGVDPGKALKDFASKQRWANIDSGQQNMVAYIRANALSDGDLLAVAAVEAIGRYAMLRLAPDLWKFSMGKQVLSRLASLIGYKGPALYSRQAMALWGNGTIDPSPELLAMRTYLASL